VNSQKSIDEQGYKAGEEVCADAFFTRKVGRARLKLVFHDTKALLDLLSSCVDFKDALDVLIVKTGAKPVVVIIKGLVGDGIHL